MIYERKAFDKRRKDVQIVIFQDLIMSDDINTARTDCVQHLSICMSIGITQMSFDQLKKTKF